MEIKISENDRINFGWNIKTHNKITELATRDNNLLNQAEKKYLSLSSEIPDLIKSEIEDMCAAHFYDPLHLDPSFGTKNDAVNNALSKFLFHTEEAMKSTDRKSFLERVGMASHYLQDASTPMHVRQGNYFSMLTRLPAHKEFEKGKKYGASTHLGILEQNYIPEEIPFDTLKKLLHENALFTIQKENQVKRANRNLWGEIQQRCFNRGVNSTKSYLDYILKYLPK